MAKRNRVTPFGDIISVQARGTLMGNRGCLHDANGNITKQSARRAWVTCLLEFNGRQRRVMSPGQYTELFFLDEATALAAGHRPCATCQRARFEEFKALWGRAMGEPAVSLDEIDQTLQAQRLASAGTQALRQSDLANLPDGVMVARQANPEIALLYWQGLLFPWTPEGYLAPLSPSAGERVTVITPQAVCSLFSSGFRPRIHQSARQPLSARLRDTRRTGTTVPEVRQRASTPSPTPHPRAVIGTLQGAPAGVGGAMYRLSETPQGHALFSYFAAILEVTGMSRGATFPLQKFVSNFSGYLNAGRIERVSGGFRLTQAGMDYFADRFRAGNRQHVSRSDVDHLALSIRTGGSGWEPI